MRWHRVLTVVIGLVSMLAFPAAGWADSQDHPVAACPPGASSLMVASATVGAYRVGPFHVILARRRLTVNAGGRVLWSSVTGVPFVGAARGVVEFADGGGFYRVHAAFSRCWRRQRVLHASATRRQLTLTGSLGRNARFTLTFSVASSARLAMTVNVAAPGVTTVLLTAGSPAHEAVHGFGAMTRWNLKGGVVPVITREQGVGRGEPGVTQAENQLTPPAGGAYHTT